MRFLARIWPHRDELADIRQEAYVRVYEAASKGRPLAPKAFLFTTARHLMADRVRRERIVSIRAGGDTDFLNVLVDEILARATRLRMRSSCGSRGAFGEDGREAPAHRRLDRWRTQLATEAGDLERALQSAQTAERLHEVRYRAGGEALQLWLAAQETRGQAELSLADSRLVRIENYATLCQTLGGGASPLE